MNWFKDRDKNTAIFLCCILQEVYCKGYFY